LTGGPGTAESGRGPRTAERHNMNNMKQCNDAACSRAAAVETLELTFRADPRHGWAPAARVFLRSGPWYDAAQEEPCP